MSTHAAQLQHGRGRARGLYTALAVLMMLPSLMPLSRVVGHWLAAQVSVIVQGFRGDEAAVQQAVSGVGGHVVRTIGIIDGVSATVPADSLGALGRSAGVREVSPNASVRMQSVTLKS